MSFTSTTIIILHTKMHLKVLMLHAITHYIKPDK